MGAERPVAVVGNGAAATRAVRLERMANVFMVVLGWEEGKGLVECEGM
jgi:hypothetical protein